METHLGNKKLVMDDVFNGFSPASSPRIYWKPRTRGRKLQVSEDASNKQPSKTAEDSLLSERRKALFETLEEPTKNIKFPPPDFESANYPKGWLNGKKRKLVNVDVVESMRRIAIQEMNRKEREIDGLNEQLDQDSRCLEHLQLQLVQERSKRAQVERENAMLQDQVNLLMNMLQENKQMGDEDRDQP